ncbi:unnamed protein product [Calypogeia fissa]
MDPTSSKVSNNNSGDEEEEWDADGFEIPSLNTGKPAPSRKERLESEKSSRATLEKVKSKPENIYLGPHGAPPKAQDASNPTNRKQKLKHKLKDAERRGTVLGRENKVEVIRDLMGGKAVAAPREPSEGWLEAYCHENQFERSK